MALLKNLALLGLCFKGGKSFIYKPVHSPEAKDWYHIDTHLWAMKKYQFNFLQLFGMNFPRTVQQMKTEQTFMNKAHSSASSHYISTTFTMIAWPRAGYDPELGTNSQHNIFCLNGKIVWNLCISPNIVLFWAQGSMILSHKVFYQSLVSVLGCVFGY